MTSPALSCSAWRSCFSSERSQDDADDQRQDGQPEAAHREAERAQDQQQDRSNACGLTAYAPIEAKNRMPAYR